MHIQDIDDIINSRSRQAATGKVAVFVMRHVQISQAETGTDITSILMCVHKVEPHALCSLVHVASKDERQA